MRWLIYYDDGSTYGDRDGSPFSARRDGVQVIAQESPATPTGFILMHKKDHYFWRADIGWQGCDLSGMYDYLIFYRAESVVLFGRVLRDEDYYATVRRAGIEGFGP